jgi:hypothetical protein
MAVTRPGALAASLCLAAGKSFVASLPAVVALSRALAPLEDVGAGRLTSQVEVPLFKQPSRIARLGDIDHHRSVHLPVLLIAEPVHLGYRHYILFS